MRAGGTPQKSPNPVPHPLPAALSAAQQPDESASIRGLYYHHMTAALARLLPDDVAGQIPALAVHLLAAAGAGGVDFTFIDREGRLPDGLENRPDVVPLDGEWACGLLLGLDADCWRVLQHCRNQIGRRPLDAPIDRVALPGRIVPLLEEPRLDNLVEQLGATGVSQLSLTVPEDCNGVIGLNAFRNAEYLHSVTIVPPVHDCRWSVQVPVRIKALDEHGGALPADRRFVDGSDGVLPVSVHVVQTGSVQSRRAARLPVDAAQVHALRTALSEVVARDPRMGGIDVGEVAVLLLGAIRTYGADFNSLQGADGSFLGLPSEIGCAIFMKLDAPCWDVLLRRGFDMAGSQSLDKVILPEAAVAHFLEMRNSSLAPNLVAQLGNIGVRKLVMRTGEAVPGDLDFRSLAQIGTLQALEVTPPASPGDWIMHVSGRVQVSASANRPACGNWVAYWRDEDAVAWAPLSRPVLGVGDEIVLGPGTKVTITPSPPQGAEPGGASTAPSLEPLIQALDLHESWHMLEPEDRGVKAKRLVAWASSGVLDFRRVPEEIAGLLEVLTPAVLHALDGCVRHLKGRGIEGVVLTSRMTSRFVVQQPTARAGGAPQAHPSSSGLAQSLRALAALKDLTLDLPADVLPNGETLPLDFLALEIPAHGQLTIHLKAPSVSGIWDVHVREGVALTVEVSERLAQEVHVHPWRADQMQRPVAVLGGPQHGAGDAPAQPDGRFIPRLVQALALHLDWGVVGPGNIGSKARALLRWAGTGDLDLARVPDEIAGLLEVLTPQVMRVLDDYVRSSTGLGIRRIAVPSATVARDFTIPRTPVGQQPPQPLATAGLRTLATFGDLHTLDVELPSSTGRPLDLRVRRTSGAGPLSIDLQVPPEPHDAVWDVYVPAGAACNAIGRLPAQSLRIIEWDGEKFSNVTEVGDARKPARGRRGSRSQAADARRSEPRPPPRSGAAAPDPVLPRVTDQARRLDLLRTQASGKLLQEMSRVLAQQPRLAGAATSAALMSFLDAAAAGGDFLSLKTTAFARADDLSAMFLQMDRACWRILDEYKQQVTGSPLESVSLPVEAMPWFEDKADPAKTANLIEQLQAQGVRRLRMKANDHSDMRYDFRRLAACAQLEVIELESLNKNHNHAWMMDLPAVFRGKVRVVARDNGFVSENFICFWQDGQRFQAVRMSELAKEGVQMPSLPLPRRPAAARKPAESKVSERSRGASEPVESLAGQRRRESTSSRASTASESASEAGDPSSPTSTVFEGTDFGTAAAARKAKKALPKLMQIVKSIDVMATPEMWRQQSLMLQRSVLGGTLDFSLRPGESDLLQKVTHYASPALVEHLAAFAGDIGQEVREVRINSALSQSLLNVGDPMKAWSSAMSKILAGMKGLRRVAIDLPAWDRIDLRSVPTPADPSRLEISIHVPARPSGVREVYVPAGATVTVTGVDADRTVRVLPWNGGALGKPMDIRAGGSAVAAFA